MIIGGVEAEVRGLVKDVAEIKGTVSQMDKRVSNLENMQRWAFGVMVGTWVTLMLAVLGLYFKRRFRRGGTWTGNPLMLAVLGLYFKR